MKCLNLSCQGNEPLSILVHDMRYYFKLNSEMCMVFTSDISQLIYIWLYSTKYCPRNSSHQIFTEDDEFVILQRLSDRIEDSGITLWYFIDLSLRLPCLKSQRFCSRAAFTSRHSINKKFTQIYTVCSWTKGSFHM